MARPSRHSTEVESEIRHARPAPDEAPLDDEDVGVTDLHRRDYFGILKRAAKSAVDDQITDAAAAIAYYGFLAIPALLLISVGVLSIFAGPGAVEMIIEKLGMLTWLWLSALALLFAAEVDAETERTRAAAA